MLTRFGKKKDDKSKDAAKASKAKLEALSEEELDRIPDKRDGYESDAGGIYLWVVVVFVFFFFHSLVKGKGFTILEPLVKGKFTQ